MGDLPDTRTPLDSLQSPTGGDIQYSHGSECLVCTGVNLNMKKKKTHFIQYSSHVRWSHIGTKQDNSLTHVTQITEIPQSVCGFNIR